MIKEQDESLTSETDLVQAQAQMTRAQFETARALAQANTIAVMAAMGLKFDKTGQLSQAKIDALVNALDIVRDVSVRLRPRVNL
ncbi:hypothetical protein [Cryobacterium zhongshanensis]|uniref:Uncharacterized protein n=1 Tax=Cryobacterium zhongshanensis TaxID=2928153 RepID=A0AA41QZ80_9MICO|nr:hypothetical protein [Cryobacterium zhongshanensis]MCI4659568.1 hypothetical protein [Cryobacterium zhongshanensis]